MRAARHEPRPQAGEVARLCRDAYLLMQLGAYRQAAIRYLQAMRLARRHRQPAPGWGGLAYAYRALWQQTGDRRYLRRYLRYTCEGTDALQIRVALAALSRLTLRTRSARNP